jgi:hypothetical protein
LLIFGACTGSFYLAAPVLYVGVTQAQLCKDLGASVKVANLPLTAYFLMMFVPVLVAWYLPSAAWLKRIMVTCFLSVGSSLAAGALVLASDAPAGLKVAAIILMAAVFGAANPTSVALLWELIGRGVAESRRGQTLAVAFGLGPLLAVAGSIGHSALVGETVFPGTALEHKFVGLDTWLGGATAGSRAAGHCPPSYVALVAAGVPIMLLAALAASRAIVPLPEHDVPRQPFVAGVFGGMAQFLTNRVLLTAIIVTMLLYLGNTISGNLTQYSQLAVGGEETEYAGQQNVLRFSFKFVTGLLLGWILTRTNPRAGVLLTGSLYTASMAWAIAVQGPWYLIAFGIFGAGELVGVYAPNYVLSASPQRDIRRNVALMQLIMVPTSLAAYLFGALAEAPIYSLATGFRVSFALCAALMGLGLAIAVFFLPARPRPAET